MPAGSTRWMHYDLRIDPLAHGCILFNNTNNDWRLQAALPICKRPSRSIGLPYSFHTQSSQRFILIKFTGTISSEEEQQAFIDFVRRDDLDKSLDLLVDRREASTEATPPDVTEQLRTVRDNMPRIDKKPRLAIVAPGDFQFGMVRMFEMKSGGDLPHHMVVVRDLEAACEWLGISESDIEWPDDDQS